MITIKKKKEIVEKYNSGVCVTNLADMYRMSKSTISTILWNTDLYKEASVAEGVAQMSKSWSTVLGGAERLLLAWLSERQMAGYSHLSIIGGNAVATDAELIKNNPSVSSQSIQKT